MKDDFLLDWDTHLVPPQLLVFNYMVDVADNEPALVIAPLEIIVGRVEYQPGDVVSVFALSKAALLASFERREVRGVCRLMQRIQYYY